MVLETMGRYAGWIALHAGLASGADVLLVPEFDYDVDEVAHVCRRRERGGQKFTIVVIAEGAKARGGELTVREVDESSPDPIRLGGVANQLVEQLRTRTNSEIRATVLGHVQRGGTPTPFDRVLATAFGHHAAVKASRGEFGCMVALRNNSLGDVPLEEVANKTRVIQKDDPLLLAALAVGTSFGTSEISPSEMSCEI
jgi:6-phosphofructokinase 1